MNQYIQVSNLAFARNPNGTVSVETVRRNRNYAGEPNGPPTNAEISILSEDDSKKLKAFFANEN